MSEEELDAYLWQLRQDASYVQEFLAMEDVNQGENVNDHGKVE